MATKQQKATALKRLNEIGKLGKGYLPRAKKLIEDPSLVNQDEFGICGMAASTHILLAYDPLRFVELLRAVFNNEEFEGIAVADSSKKAGDLLEHRLEQYWRKAYRLPRDQALTTGQVLDLEKRYQEAKGIDRAEDRKLDFLVCRSLGKLLKKTNVPLYTGTKDFSKKFAPGLGVLDSQILKAGDLALTGEAVDFMLKEIVQVPVVVSHDSSKLTSGDVIFNTVNGWFSTHTGREPLIVAAVNRGLYKDLHPRTGAQEKGTAYQDLDGWLTKGVAPNQAFVPRGPNEPDYDHWILITGPMKSMATSTTGLQYEIPVWTWGKYYTARLRQAHMDGYIAWLVCVSLDPQKTSMPMIVTKTSVDWVADSKSHACALCGEKIGMGSRHHCRLCGKLFCDNCSPEREMVPGRQAKADHTRKVGEKFSPIPGPVRVCATCFQNHAGFHWVLANEAKNIKKCKECGEEFGFTRWRYHCHYCGQLVCTDKKCSEKKACARIGYVKPVLICKTCVKDGKYK